ncbi:riboflavin biosynthesis RibT protein [Weissella beninensis]|uniref:N-acetyltransferase n=1 Tax=Periweissella beninensis TaxID=504936 RepID=A0ABT0VI67_9LACO|nr:N-acetyltransferase [Periweissella beninensis]MBM7543809.1 riboflavin biosynthesis RibT protein [Periweissella beninensis]MCM2436808.1 N-acetyltransferase [Periweissella beninensis]
MLVKYRDDFKKNAMGLLSYVPGLRDVNRLDNEFSWYAISSTRELLLWRDNNGHFIALVGVEHTYGVLVLRYVSIMPEFRNGPLLFEVLDALNQCYPNEILMGTIAGQKIVNAWRRNYEQRTANQIK